MAFSKISHNSLPRRRVVVTGMGVLAPNGATLAAFWDSIVHGRSAAAPVKRFDTTLLPTKIACELKDFEPREYFEPRKARRFDLSIQYGLAASKMAVKDSGIVVEGIHPDKIALVEATSVSGLEGSIKAVKTYNERGYSAMSPFTLINSYCGGGSGEMALELGIHGHAISLSTGSASGNDAIGYGLRLIQDDEMDVVVAGGSEAPVIEQLFGAFCQTKVMTTRNQNPGAAMRPLDKNRDGFLLGEGAAYLVLEEHSHALGRGATIYAEVAGQGRSCEAYHSVAPHPDGVGVLSAMQKALFMAQMHHSEVDYINVHGTATHANDVAEMKAIRTLFKEDMDRVAISSTKPVTGHLLAAAGAVESVACCLAVQKGIIPHTLNLSEPDAG